MPKHTEEVLMKLSCMLSVLPLPERILFLLACLVNSTKPTPALHFTQLYSSTNGFVQSPAEKIVSVGSSSELVGAWCAWRPRILGAGAESFSPVRASAHRSCVGAGACCRSVPSSPVCVWCGTVPSLKEVIRQECSQFYL